MKCGLISQAAIGLMVALGAIVTQIQPSYARDKFFCGYKNSEPATFVRTSRGNMPIIRWADGAFPPPWTPIRRCQVVSDRFERFYDNGTLKYIKAGWMGGQPVLCVAGYRGGRCLPNGLLVTLKSGADPNLTLQRMLDRRALATGRPLDLSGGTGRRRGGPRQTTTDLSGNNDRSLLSELNGESYFDIESFLNESN
ncbi:MAG: COP23 domain-containing protein [Prochloraceae cyanobacterium]|nr:COP23 domain-containing protein [Prochloraceae cyanobacterium]